jgi:prepilin-type N-terminal cleavage/methylation domain-containing protein
MVKVRGLTLIEVLVVVAIVAIITAIISPSLIHAKKSAMGSVNTAQLRQAGVAHGIYVADFGEAFPDSRVLVNAGYLEEALLADPLDPTPSGWMNVLRDGPYPTIPSMGDPSAHFDSYWNVKETLGQLLIDRLMERDPNFGWLVAPYMTAATGVTDYWGPYVGTYKRLRFDGSAITRRHRTIPEELLSEGQTTTAQSHHSYFSDLDDYGSFE